MAGLKYLTKIPSIYKGPKRRAQLRGEAGSACNCHLVTINSCGSSAMYLVNLHLSDKYSGLGFYPSWRQNHGSLICLSNFCFLTSRCLLSQCTLSLDYAHTLARSWRSVAQLPFPMSNVPSCNWAIFLSYLMVNAKFFPSLLKWLSWLNLFADTINIFKINWIHNQQCRVTEKIIKV